MVEADLPAVLALNHAHVELLSPMDEARLRLLIGWACRSDVIVCDGRVAGFVLVFAPGTAYDSPNYRWFTSRYGERFLYLDRVVVDDRYRRRGLATAAYDLIEAGAADHGRLVLEVNVDPPNDASLAFHGARGYEEVGRLGEDGHVVALMAKALGCSAHGTHTKAGGET
jgi:predicted GNAT superfamily acetyltransferase